MIVAFLVRVKTVSLTNQREHWRARASRVAAQRLAVKVAFPVLGRMQAVDWLHGSLDHLAERPLVVTLTRIAPGRLDSDNLPSSMKSIRDQIADQLVIDDGSDRIDWRYRQERGKRGAYAVLVEVAAVAK